MLPTGFFHLGNTSGPRKYVGTCDFTVGDGFTCSTAPTIVFNPATGISTGKGGGLLRGMAFSGLPDSELTCVRFRYATKVPRAVFQADLKPRSAESPCLLRNKFCLLFPSMSKPNAVFKCQVPIGFTLSIPQKEGTA